MAVDYRNGVAIFSLIVYLPCFFVAVYVALRHGFAKAAGWYFLVMLSLVRIVGACLELATIANPSEGLFTGAAVCNSVGVSPLILACIGLINRANNSIINRGKKGVPPIVFRVIGVLVLVGLILAIVGITNRNDGDMPYTPSVESKAAICITLGVWVITIGAVFIINANKQYLPDGEKKLLLAIAISLPFILVRLLYSFISAFSRSPKFSIVSGDVTIYLLMAVLEEMVVVITFIAVGVTLQQDGTAAYKGESGSDEEEMRFYPEGRDTQYGQSVPAPYSR
ncbi:hypothetical protein MGYG_03118 [Nannizzia gypsea CBS 118893]|uniref:DUF7702 domain-containing protein n=1 Tax=Arthroderma gypseum (strain ATCC MYA-4604 / CBS 118893) TaxID=535722 RepID=E4UQZ7_ARTGP|nr:hypothetical protein MGYG_03118 [Nannizzia gypsea CBS 118893]EFR00112.1 hypothetical protein MGYG_03118 [Nannizzia gypsea CBS 118893]